MIKKWVCWSWWGKKWRVKKEERNERGKLEDRVREKKKKREIVWERDKACYGDREEKKERKRDSIRKG